MVDGDSGDVPRCGAEIRAYRSIRGTLGEYATLKDTTGNGKREEMKNFKC